jgi:hypothetical protein
MLLLPAVPLGHRGGEGFQRCGFNHRVVQLGVRMLAGQCPPQTDHCGAQGEPDYCSRGSGWGAAKLEASLDHRGRSTFINAQFVRRGV